MQFPSYANLLWVEQYPPPKMHTPPCDAVRSPPKPNLISFHCCRALQQNDAQVYPSRAHTRFVIEASTLHVCSVVHAYRRYISYACHLARFQIGVFSIEFAPLNLWWIYFYAAQLKWARLEVDSSILPAIRISFVVSIPPSKIRLIGCWLLSRSRSTRLRVNQSNGRVSAKFI